MSSVPRAAPYRPGTGSDRYARFAQDLLDVTRTYVFDEITKAVAENKQVLCLGANGIGKSFTAATLGIAALYCNPNTTVPITAGTGSTLEDNIWKPIKSLYNDTPLPGRYLENKRELRTEFDPEWYLKCVAPKYPDDLEGDHNENLLYIIEEADKPGITYEHIDSVRSTVTSENDRILVIANPPEDEANCVHRLIESDEWHTISFSSWDSHNVRIERGLENGVKIDKLADISKLKSDWREYHREEWPGLEQVIKWSDPDSDDFRTDLHQLWYKRRAGCIPPQGASAWRPFSVSDVRTAYNRAGEKRAETPDVFALDVARKGGDSTIGLALYDEHAEIEYESEGTEFVQQRLEIQDLRDEWPHTPIVIDAVGQGSGLADELKAKYPDVLRFDSQTIAAQKDEYKNKWSEGLQVIGEWLDGLGNYNDEKLYNELTVTARTVQFNETTLRRGQVVEATPKQDIKDELGRSPDRLDALLMALHKRDIMDSNRGKVSPTFSW